MTHLTKAEWLQACHFHDLTERQVLDEVAARTKKTHKPLVLLDLDSTLYEVAPRSHQILREWLETIEIKSFPKVRSALLNLKSEHIGYSLKDTFASIGLSENDAETEQALAFAKKFWAKRFFNNDYLRYDHPYPGAVQFAQEIHKLGAEIVYLTGRDEPGMGDGTRDKLLDDDFPWDVPRTHLIMKKAFDLPDMEHKLEAARSIKKLGTLIASFENEPANLAALYHAHPDAMHVFVDTVSSDHPAVICKGLYRIKGFAV